MNTPPKSPNSVAVYIAAQPHEARAALTQVRAAIRKAVPEADELISYHMPTYKLGGETVLNFAVWKRHFSLYAATAAVHAHFQSDLAGYKVDKGTIQFPYSQPVPIPLIERIAKFRATEIAHRLQNP